MTQQLALYLPDSFTGMQKKNGQSLGSVQTLIDSSERQLGIVEHVWSEGDLAIIDNLQVMHRSGRIR